MGCRTANFSTREDTLTIAIEAYASEQTAFDQKQDELKQAQKREEEAKKKEATTTHDDEEATGEATTKHDDGENTSQEEVRAKKKDERSDADKIEDELKEVPLMMRCPLRRFSATLVLLESNTKEYWWAQATKYTHSVVVLVFLSPCMPHVEKVRRLQQIPLISGKTHFGNLGIIADLKQSGEPVTNPNVRLTIFPEVQYGKTVNALLEARHGKSEAFLHEREIVCAFDGGKKGNIQNKLLDPWLPPALRRERQISQYETTKNKRC